MILYSYIRLDDVTGFFHYLRNWITVHKADIVLNRLFRKVIESFCEWNKDNSNSLRRLLGMEGLDLIKKWIVDHWDSRQGINLLKTYGCLVRINNEFSCSLDKQK